MYTNDEAKRMSVEELHRSLIDYCGRKFDKDVLRGTAELIKEGILDWKWVEKAVDQGEVDGLDELLESAGYYSEVDRDLEDALTPLDRALFKEWEGREPTKEEVTEAQKRLTAHRSEMRKGAMRFLGLIPAATH